MIQEDEFEDIIFVTKRKTQRACKNAAFRLNLQNGQFVFNEALSDNLNLKSGQGIMFGFNRKSKKAYLLKDSEPDCFFPKAKKGENVHRFTCKELAEFFDETFELLDTDLTSFSFKVANESNEKGMYLIEYLKK